MLNDHRERFAVVVGVAFMASVCRTQARAQTTRLSSTTGRAAVSCIGDCNADDAVTVNELIRMVDILFGTADISTCAAGDANGDGTISVNEIVAGVDALLKDCPLPAPTSTPPAGPTATPNIDACAGKPDGTTCDGGTDAPQTLICISGTCGPCTPSGSASPRFVDNTNGTITDRQTCLVWEKKSADNGIHDKDDTFTWSTGTNSSDGTLFTVFLGTLNAAACFAGHCDWRLPNEDGNNAPFIGPRELESILASPCAGSPCVAPAFNSGCHSGCDVTACSCTQPNGYWSATTVSASPDEARLVSFFNATQGTPSKTDSFYARAVRGGPASSCVGKPDGTTCDALTDASFTRVCTSGVCEPCVASAGASPRFVDNRNGTVTDRSTCLVWEKKDNAGSLNDQGRNFTWSTGTDNPDGTVFTQFIAQLNAVGFGDHSDWRLPTSAGTAGLETAQPAEIESIVDTAAPGCGSGAPCVDPVFNTNCGSGGNANAGCTINGRIGTQECSCTAPAAYWSASPVSGNPTTAWIESFNDGSLISDIEETNGAHARAVRGGPAGPCSGKPDGTTCDAGIDGPHTLICTNNACGPCTASPAALPRFVDNGDGTITDRQTCLVWEKKDNAADIHDLSGFYMWSSTGTDMDGSAFTIFLAPLNAGRFAQHGDWRLPTSAGNADLPTGQRAEIESLVDTGVAGCTSGGPCVDPAFNTNCGTNGSGNGGCTSDREDGAPECSCTAPSRYWSASPVSDDPAEVWFQDFGNGALLHGVASANNFQVRAVRGGPADPCPGKPDGTTCDAGIDAQKTQICVSGACGACAANPSASPRFVDNGDGTITDRHTCLVWEKKSDDGGVHDKDNTFTWSAGANNPDGTVFTTFLAALHTGSCFAGHCDWRLPKEDGENAPFTGPTELETIVGPCSGGLCVPSAFETGCTPGCAVTGCSCTQPGGYWSATTNIDDPTIVWTVAFDADVANVFGVNKPSSLFVRAVRGGS